MEDGNKENLHRSLFHRAQAFRDSGSIGHQLPSHVRTRQTKYGCHYELDCNAPLLLVIGLVPLANLVSAVKSRLEYEILRAG